MAFCGQGQMKQTKGAQAQVSSRGKSVDVRLQWRLLMYARKQAFRWPAQTMFSMGSV